MTREEAVKRIKRFLEERNENCDEDEIAMCIVTPYDADHIYAWADVLLPAPKQIYPSKPVKIDPAEFHLTKDQLMDFLEDYKRSFERGYTE